MIDFADTFTEILNTSDSVRLDCMLRAIEAEQARRRTIADLAVSASRSPVANLFETVIAEICDQSGLTRRDITGPSQLRSIVRPRQLAMTRIHTKAKERDLGVSLQMIGNHFGGRNHSTVFSAIRACAARGEV